jgi:hypothetical protein
MDNKAASASNEKLAGPGAAAAAGAPGPHAADAGWAAASTDHPPGLYRDDSGGPSGEDEQTSAAAFGRGYAR